MKSLEQRRIRIFEINSRAVTIALSLMLLFALIAVPTPAAQAQTYSIIHNFFGGQDGATPEAGLTVDTVGNLYGTASAGGSGYGTAYRLQYEAGWPFNPLFDFDGDPTARVVFGPDGRLYGAEPYYSGGRFQGTVFNLGPPPRACPTLFCAWNFNYLWVFSGAADGGHPGYGDLIFDQTGNMYGTTVGGGSSSGGGYGVVFEMTGSGYNWTERPLYAFSGGTDGQFPYNGVIFDNAGNLYGTTYAGGLDGYGTAFELSPSQGGGYWTENCLYSFHNGSDGSSLRAGLTFDKSRSNLYGATSDGGSGGGGTVFKLTPGANCSWTYTLLYSFSGNVGRNCGPWASLAMDTAGNLYGTTYCDGANSAGSVFKLTPTPTPPWTYTSLHDFTGGSDGGNPVSNVLLHPNGKLYGTASVGGSQGVGVIWEITPN